MRTLWGTLAAVFAAALMLYGITACHIEKPPDTKAAAPLVGEFATAGGSRLTFADDGDNDWSAGDVLVEFAADAEYLLEGRANNTLYHYVFGMHNLPAPYDVADDFQLSNGEEWFANCHSRYTATDILLLQPYSPGGEELAFRRVAAAGKGGTYSLVPGDNGYFTFTKED